MRKPSCRHDARFAPIRAASDLGGHGVAVICLCCGGFQRPLPSSFPMSHGPVDPHTFPWCGTEAAASAVSLPEGARIDLLGEATTDLRAAHAAAFAVAAKDAHKRRDAAWFLNHGQMPSFWEVKADEKTGDLLYREVP